MSLACSECNRYKGSDLCSLDPVTQEVVPLFHPRRETWNAHFRLKEGRIEALSATGRVTVRLLHLNDGVTVERRRALIELGRYPQ